MMTLLFIMAFAMSGLASTWTPSQSLASVQLQDGWLEVPGGVAVLLEPRPLGAMPELQTELGLALELQGTSDGYLLPAAGTSRRLRVQAAPDSRLRVRLVEQRGNAASWDRYERALWRGLDTCAVPEPPWGGERLQASLALRCAAVSDRGVLGLGLVYDLAPVRPIDGLAHGRERPDERLLPAGTQATLTAQGPATLQVFTQHTQPGRFLRYGLTVDAGEERWLDQLIASTGAAPTGLRLWIPDGEHTVKIGVLEADVLLSTQLRPYRPPGPVALAPATSIAAVDAAELAWVRGQQALALEGFSALLGQPGPIGELAQARSIALLPPGPELEGLATVPESCSSTGREVIAAKVFSRRGRRTPRLSSPFSVRARNILAANCWASSVSSES